MPTLLMAGTFWQDFKGHCSEELGKPEIQQAPVNVTDSETQSSMDDLLSVGLSKRR